MREKRERPEFIRNLDNCIRDAYRAEKAEPEEQAIPADYDELLRQLNLARVTLPSEHRDGAADPFRETLISLGPEGFQHLWDVFPAEDETRNGFLLRDIAQALLERAPLPVEETADPAGDGLRKAARARRQATDAFQEVVFDLYDTFLSPQWRRYRPNFSRLPPVVKWGNPYDLAPYTWDTSSTLPFFGVECGVVSLPPAYAKRGLLGWAAIPHECSGHDVLSADAGFHAEIEEKLKKRVADLRQLEPIGEYWLRRWDEAAADLMAIMNMGPAAAVALLGFFRARRQARGSRKRLESVDKDPDGGHPIDIMRAAAWVAAIERLAASREEEEGRQADPSKRAELLQASAKDLRAWAQAIEDEARNDLAVTGEEPQNLEEREVDPKRPGAKRMIKLKVSRTGRPVYATFTQAKDTAQDLLKVLESPLDSLGGARLQEFANWTLEDERAVEAIERFYRDHFEGRQFVSNLGLLASKRAALRFAREYGPFKDAAEIAKLKFELNELWLDHWSMEGLWAAHAVAAAIRVALNPPDREAEELEEAVEKLIVAQEKGPLPAVRQRALLAPMLDPVEDDQDRGEVKAYVAEAIVPGLKKKKADDAVERLAEIHHERAVRIAFRQMTALLALMHNNNRRWGAEEEPSWTRSGADDDDE